MGYSDPSIDCPINKVADLQITVSSVNLEDLIALQKLGTYVQNKQITKINWIGLGRVLDLEICYVVSILEFIVLKVMLFNYKKKFLQSSIFKGYMHLCNQLCVHAPK